MKGITRIVGDKEITLLGQSSAMINPGGKDAIAEGLRTFNANDEHSINGDT
jgi:hypothetical protein